MKFSLVTLLAGSLTLACWLGVNVVPVNKSEPYTTVTYVGKVISGEHRTSTLGWPLVWRTVKSFTYARETDTTRDNKNLLIDIILSISTSLLVSVSIEF